LTKEEELEKTKSELNKIRKNTVAYIENSSKDVEHLKNNIIAAKGYQNYLNLTFDLINDISKNANNIPDVLFHEIKLSTGTVTTSGPTFSIIAGQSAGNVEMAEQHNSTINATKVYVVSGAISLSKIAENNPTFFPNAPTIIPKYEAEDELEKNISYIKSQLPIIIPNILDDFNKFVTNFRAQVPAETKYTYLIGFRTTLFYKWIYKYTVLNFGVEYPRIKAIELFATCGKRLDPLDNPIIVNVRNLYGELSNQDENAPNSVKLGAVNQDYNEQLFRRLIAGTAALLTLREKYK